MLIVDTGPLVAAADRSDRHHDRFREVIETDPGPFVTTAMVVAETAYLLDRQLGADAEVALYDMILEGRCECSRSRQMTGAGFVCSSTSTGTYRLEAPTPGSSPSRND